MSRQTGEERLPAGFARDLKGLRVEAYSPETKRLTFNLVSATNLKTPNDGHVPCHIRVHR
jgi:hypothetical protein